MIYTIRIDGDPYGKARARHFKGIVYSPGTNKTYGQRVRQAFREKYGDCIIQGAVVCRITAHFRIPASDTKKRKELKKAGNIFCTKKPDNDNLEKEIWDYLPWQVGDQQVVENRTVKLWDDEPYVEVVIDELEKDY